MPPHPLATQATSPRGRGAAGRPTARRPRPRTPPISLPHRPRAPKHLHLVACHTRARARTVTRRRMPPRCGARAPRALSLPLCSAAPPNPAPSSLPPLPPPSPAARHALPRPEQGLHGDTPVQYDCLSAGSSRVRPLARGQGTGAGWRGARRAGGGSFEGEPGGAAIHPSPPSVRAPPAPPHAPIRPVARHFEAGPITGAAAGSHTAA
jgi:hypothetical protein